MSTTTTQKILEGFSRYQTKRKLGTGGMATVFLADDLVLKREVALKIMHEHLLNSPEAAKRFSNEAQAVASLSHENIIKVFDYGEIETRPFLVMEYNHGSTLISLIEKNGALPNLVAVEIARQILSGLSAAHGKGIFHRDIKPDNIMIDTDGTVKIMDFGIAYVVNRESLTHTGSFIGSPNFISPEQAKGEPLTGTTDIFSLGVLLYMSLTNSLPFAADVPAAIVHSIIHDTPEPACVRNKKTLFWVSGFIDACLTKDPKERPNAASALLLLEKEILVHGLSTGKTLLRAYASDPVHSGQSEEKRLFDHYRHQAHEAIKKRRIAGAVKSLEQARCFGQLALEDERAIRRHTVRSAVRKYTAIVAVAALCIGAVSFFILHLVPGQEDHDTTASPAIVTPPGLDSSSIEPPVVQNLTPAQPEIILDSSTPVKNNPVQVKKIAMDTPSARVVSPAWLSIRTNPPWSKVFIDDIERGMTPSKTVYAVKSGPHEVRIVKDGFAAYQSMHIPADNETLAVRIMLRPLSQQNQ